MCSNSQAYTVAEASIDEWEPLLGELPCSSVFHTSPWFRVIESVHGATVRLPYALDDEGRCAAVWPVFVMRKGPLRILGSPVPGWSTAYLGPLFATQCEVGKALDALLNHDLLRQGSYFSCKALNQGHAIDLGPYGFEETERLETYCLDLTQPEEALWSNLKGECRTQIRKARNLGLEIRRETDASFIDEYWVMSQETFAVCQIKPTFSRPFVETMWRELHSSGRVCALSAFLKGERIAMLMLPFDRQTMYYWGGASFVRHRGIPAHNLLHWEAIRHAQQLGLRCYDFVSTAGGAGRFKKTFGPRVVHVATHWERTSSAVIRALKNGYQWYLLWQQRLSA
jgi:hypothetical protein